MNPTDLSSEVIIHRQPLSRAFSVHLDNGAVGIGRVVSGNPDEMIVNLIPFAHRIWKEYPNDVPEMGQGVPFKRTGPITYQYLSPDLKLVTAIVAYDLGWLVSDGTVEFAERTPDQA